MIRPELAELPSYVPGRPAALGVGVASYKLSSNENPYPPLPGVLAAIEAALGSIHRYPDLGCAELITTLAGRLGVQPGALALGTGSVAVLYHLIQACCPPGAEVITAWRSFEAYPIAIRQTGARHVTVPLTASGDHDLGAMLAAITPATRMIIVCTPNNPTGPAIDHDRLAAFVEAVDGRALVIVDEAYQEFAVAPPRTHELITNWPNVGSLRTFSKAYGLAGLRVGYLVAHPMIAEAVRKVALPFGVSSLGQVAALASLAAEAELRKRVELINRRRDALADGLRLHGLTVPKSEANFVWLPLGARTGEVVRSFAKAGLTVRGFADDGIRITVGEPEACARVIEVAKGLPLPDTLLPNL